MVKRRRRRHYPNGSDPGKKPSTLIHLPIHPRHFRTNPATPLGRVVGPALAVPKNGRAGPGGPPARGDTRKAPILPITYGAKVRVLGGPGRVKIPGEMDFVFTNM